MMKLKKWIERLLTLVALGLQGMLVAQPGMGGNLNENLEDLQSYWVTESQSEYVRGFINVMNDLEVLNGTITGYNASKINGNTGVDNLIGATFLNVDGAPVKILLSFKLNFKQIGNGDMPAPNSAEANHILDAIEYYLTQKNFGQYIHIITVGNEPMWETKNADAQKLKAFTERLIDRVEEIRTDKGWNYQIYVGALNRAGEANIRNNNPIFKTILDIAQNNPKVDGLDLHIHLLNMPESPNTLAYFRNTLNFQKGIIVTEYSLQRMLQAHLNDRLDQGGPPPPGFSGSLLIYEYLNQIMDQVRNNQTVDRVAYEQFWESRPWYPANYIDAFYKDFCDYNVDVATYAFFRKNLPNFTLNANAATWVFNGLFNEQLFGLDGNQFARNPMVFPEYSLITSGVTSCQNVTRVDKELQMQIRVWPNPATHELHIELPGPEPASADMWDPTGRQLLHDLPVENGSTLILPDSLVGGIYLLLVTQAEQSYPQQVMIR